jgi:hypothetical protein
VVSGGRQVIKVDWPKLVEGRTYRYTLFQEGKATIVREWTIRGPNTIDSAHHFKQTVARWLRREQWTVKVEEIR